MRLGTSVMEPQWPVCPCSTSLRTLSYPAKAALAQMTAAMPILARSSARSSP